MNKDKTKGKTKGKVKEKINILITGGSGFIGHHIVEHILRSTDWDIVILDRLDLSGNLERIADIRGFNGYKKRLKFVWHDLKAEVNPYIKKEIGEVDYIMHLAASTHVDRSIEDPMLFVQDNVVATCNILNFARGLKKLKKFINFGTDEVFGPAPDGYAHKETDAFNPSNPYSATKAGASALGRAFFITYKLPVINTYTMNNFGERQHPEKLIPKCIRSVENEEAMPVFATIRCGITEAIGSRYWIHCKETASAMLFLLDKGKPGESYNIIGFEELTNLEICEIVAKAVGKELIPDFIDFHRCRPGHDRRYALDGTKLKELGWSPRLDVRTSLAKVVKWTLNNKKWL